MNFDFIILFLDITNVKASLCLKDLNIFVRYILYYI